MSDPTPQYMEGDPLENAERLLAGVVDWMVDEEHRSSRVSLSRGEAADLEVALAEVRRAAFERPKRWGSNE